MCANGAALPLRLSRVARILIHMTSGPESPTRAALGFLVARAAIEEGHDVDLFLAGDSVQLLRDSVLDSLVGLGTGSLRESYDAVVTSGARIYASGMSSKARGHRGNRPRRETRRARDAEQARATRSRERPRADVLAR